MPLYDAFISYSHAKDKPVASALQSVIQRLGKPWYKRRALRVFRDDTSLSATPQLWPSIEKALGESRYLILLSSPESAASPWVGKEVEYWLKHKSIDTLFIGVTGGRLDWNGKRGDFKWSAKTPLPKALKGRFAAEPKWVDLTPYRKSADPRDARFIELGADFAAAIHGTPKEDLLSQEVRQQRRALTLAMSAAGLLLVLATGAVTAGVVAKVQAERAERNFAAAKDTVDSLIFDIAQGLRHVEGLRVESLDKILNRVRGAVDRLNATAPGNVELLRSRAAMFDEFATTYLASGNMAAALESAHEGLALARQVAAADKDDPARQRDVSVSLTKVGDVKLAQGDGTGALAAYAEALDIRHRIAEAAPDNAQARHDVAVALGRIGDAKFSLGDSSGALAAYQQGLAIDRHLSEAGEDNTDRQRDVLVGLQYIGDVKLQQGDQAGAVAAYDESLAIARGLVESDPGNTAWQRDISVALNRIADAKLASADYEGALEAYQESLAIRRRLADTDKGNIHWQRDVTVSLEQIAYVKLVTNDLSGALAAYQESLDLRRRLADADKANPERQRDVAAALDSLGDAKTQKGDHAGALGAYDEGLAMRRQLAELQKANTEWQRDLSVGLIKFGDAKLAQGDGAAALAAYEEALAIRRRLAGIDQANAGWQFDLVVGLYKFAMATGGERRAHSLDEALHIANRLEAEGKLSPAQKGWKDRLLGQAKD